MKEREHNKKIKKITEKTAGVDLKYWRNTENINICIVSTSEIKNRKCLR